MQVEPKFHDDASNLEQLVPFEECIELHSTERAIVRAPEYLLLTHNGRSFKLVIITKLFFFFKYSCYLLVDIFVTCKQFILYDFVVAFSAL